MLITTLGLTYLGVLLFYAASPTTGAAPILGSRRWGRLGGGLILGVGLGCSTGVTSVETGMLIWLSMGIAAGSLLAIAGPLVDRFVPTTGLLAFGSALLGLFL
ncbi:putative lipid-binding transport protein (Tim44 family) [Salinibacter ruber]|uniref:hypothetical protein n=1 Tax=Salinibacter ruber TaxID=146919 RepID=UPI002168F0FC|nr:hypothetical protein [Salinibacter ruber]MCS3861547.1 putative lipid-binding transport protein (Tim44 family) [Salinibacter ruber]